MVELFEGCLILGVGGLVGMAGLQLGHVVGGHGHAGDAGSGVHLGDSGHGLHIGDSNLHVGDSTLHLGDAGHAGYLGHIGDAGHAGHIGDAGHAGHIGDAGHVAHAGDTGHMPHDISQAHPHAHAHGLEHVHGHHGESGEEAVGLKMPLWLIPSPIRIFSWLIGFGLAGIIFRQWIPPYLFTLLITIALLNALVFERFVVRPYWDFLFRFASAPGTNLEGTVATRAIAVTSFNRSGRGLVRVCVDGQDRDVLARLLPGKAPVPVRKGDTLFVERADEDNTLLVSKPEQWKNA